MEWLEDDLVLITQRNKDLLLLDISSKPYKKTTLKIPAKIHKYSQGGLLDIKKHPNFINNSWLYITFSQSHFDKALSSTSLARFKIKQNKIKDFEILFTAKPWLPTSHHYGSRIAFDKNNYIYFTTGDRGKRYLAQKLNNHLGKVIRLKDDGSLINKSPFKKNLAIFSYGHRNPQGLVFHKEKLYLHEHGPRGGDELNLIEIGKNYGWPIVSYGREYNRNAMVGEARTKKGIEKPLHYWVPSIAPSGLDIYRGKEFPKWSENILLGSLKFGLLVILKFGKNQKVIKSKQLFNGKLGRIRDINVKNGFIYILTDSNNGMLIKLSNGNL